MSTPQFIVRISFTLDKRVKQFAKDNNITKTKVIIDAWNYYFGCVEGIPTLVFYLNKFYLIK